MLRKLSCLVVLISFLLMFGCKISGTITGGDENGIEGIKVLLHGKEGDLATYTDIDGKYSFGNILPLDYLITPLSEEYAFNPVSKSVKILSATTTINFVILEEEPTCADDPCGENTYCDDTGGVITCSCIADYEDCNTDPTDGCEANTLYDSNNCGECGTSCHLWQTCFQGICEDKQFRFTDMNNGTIRDNESGLIWLKNANCTDLAGTDSNGKAEWGIATAAAASLSSGTCGLEDDSSPGDWRLPKKEECEAFISDIHQNPALANTEGNGEWSEGDAFIGVLSECYWSSSVDDEDTFSAWNMDLAPGTMHYSNKGWRTYVWPVRSVSCYTIPAGDLSVCSGQGRCVGPDECECVAGYTGSACETEL